MASPTKRSLTPERWRALVAWAERSYRLSQRRACRAVEAARSTIQYIAVRPPQDALRARLRELAGVRVSYGYPRLTILLRREGWHVNKKRVYRLYRDEGISGGQVNAVSDRADPDRHNGPEFSLAFRLTVQEAGIEHHYVRLRRPQQSGKVERSHRIERRGALFGRRC